MQHFERAVAEMAEQKPQSEQANLQWYVIQTFTGWEKRVKTAIEHLTEIEGLAHKVERVLVPLKKMLEAKGGKQREVYRNVMPGYVFIRMEADNHLFDLIQKIQGVSMFLGPEGHPTPLSEAEINNVFDAIRERPDRQQVIVKFRVGDQIRVIGGPFEGIIGTVEHVDEDKGRLKVSVNILGRATSLELDVSQVEDAVQ